MKRKERILRIRPFNMANFSGAGGYIPIFAMLGAFISFPATLLLWLGMAYHVKNEDGSLNIALLKRRLAQILLPLGFLSLILWFFIVTDQISIYGGNLVGAMIAIVLVVVLHIGGMFLSIFCSAKLAEKSHFTSSKWFLLTLAIAALMVVVGIIVPMLLFFIAL